MKIFKNESKWKNNLWMTINPLLPSPISFVSWTIYISRLFDNWKSTAEKQWTHGVWDGSTVFLTNTKLPVSTANRRITEQKRQRSHIFWKDLKERWFKKWKTCIRSYAITHTKTHESMDVKKIICLFQVLKIVSLNHKLFNNVKTYLKRLRGYQRISYCRIEIKNSLQILAYGYLDFSLFLAFSVYFYNSS